VKSAMGNVKAECSVLKVKNLKLNGKVQSVIDCTGWTARDQFPAGPNCWPKGLPRSETLKAQSYLL
jgi:hypothetical protein